MVGAALKAQFSSERGDWETPAALFEELDAEFHFTLDVCANETNKKCKWYFGPTNSYTPDGLAVRWGHAICWMNPPYGREIGKWIAKASAEAQKGATVVALLPARTDTRWFHDFIYGKHEVRFLRGRLKFVGAPSSAPFPSIIVVFRPNAQP